MKFAFAMCLMTVVACSANGQESPARRQPSPEDMKQLMETSFGAMAPMMGKMTEAMLEAQLSVAEKPETAKRVATFKKNLFDELQKQGFSKRDALAIVQTTPLPAAAPSQR